jgi:phosphoribosylformylglycinamidine synthase
VIYIAGVTRGELGGSSYERLKGIQMGDCPAVDPESAYSLYRQFHEAIRAKVVRSCHDISDGGLAVALAESALSGNLGAEIDLADIAANDETMAEERLLFCESPSRFILSVAKESIDEFEKIMSGSACVKAGTVTDTARIFIKRSGRLLVDTDLARIRTAWETGGF